MKLPSSDWLRCLEFGAAAAWRLLEFPPPSPGDTAPLNSCRFERDHYAGLLQVVKMLVGLAHRLQGCAG
jgi:hypothetical protein